MICYKCGKPACCLVRAEKMGGMVAAYIASCKEHFDNLNVNELVGKPPHDKAEQEAAEGLASLFG